MLLPIPFAPFANILRSNSVPHLFVRPDDGDDGDRFGLFVVLLCVGKIQNAWAKKLNLAEQTAAVS